MAKGRKIILKNDTTMSTGYQGRGFVTEYKTFKAGSEVFYNKLETKSGTYHTVWAIEDGKKWEASKVINPK